MKNSLVRNALLAIPFALMYPCVSADADEWWFSDVHLEPGEIFKFHHEEIVWDSLWMWVTIDVEVETHLSFHDVMMLDGVEESIWEEVWLVDTFHWEIHKHYESVTYTGEWLTIENIGNTTAWFDLHIEKTPTPGALSLLAFGGIFASRRRRS